MFTLLKTEGRARRGAYHTAHGDIQTPVFMNVATQAAIKGGVSSHDLRDIACQVALCNTYHLHLRPGEETVRTLGGLHGFMDWQAPTLTDSGGFQVFSLAERRKISEEGVAFQSHIDGRHVFMSPEDSIRIQWALGADIVMAFDECIPFPSDRAYILRSTERTTRWLVRCVSEWQRLEGSQTRSLWGINQGGTDHAVRAAHMKDIAALDLPGYAIGGLAVGEPAEDMYRVLETLDAIMPIDKPRYLMGVGTPMNLLEGIRRGVDFFDCVLPARNARHGHLFTHQGRLNIKNQKYASDPDPVDEHCACPLCRHFSRAYLRHLFQAGELLALRLAVLHNLFFYNHLMAAIRKALDDGVFEDFYQRMREKYA